MSHLKPLSQKGKEFDNVIIWGDIPMAPRPGFGPGTSALARRRSVPLSYLGASDGAPGQAPRGGYPSTPSPVISPTKRAGNAPQALLFFAMSALDGSFGNRPALSVMRPALVAVNRVCVLYADKRNGR